MRTISLARHLAAIQNGRKSQGPVTAEGKRKVSFNALDHGLCANQLLLPGESRARLDAHFQSIAADLRPQTYTEALFTRRFAACSWRLLRAEAFENGLIREQLAKTEPGPDPLTTVSTAWADSRARLATRYEMENERAVHRNLEAFLGLTLLRGASAIDQPAEKNQSAAPEIEAHRNKPKAENASPESGDQELAA